MGIPVSRFRRSKMDVFQCGYTSAKPTGNFIDDRGVNLVDNVKDIKALGQNCDSVCQIQFEGGSGTGFRVGSKYVMTALHVVEAMCKGTHSISGRCVFRYYNTNEKGEAYEVMPDVCFRNEETDAAIIELVEVERPFPPPFKLFGVPNLTSTFTFIGHDGGHPMKCNKVDLIIDKDSPKTLKDIELVRKKSTEVAIADCDFPPLIMLNNKHRLLFHCQFSKGASGSPGILLNSDGAAVVVTMLLCGYPNWYYDENFNREIKSNWPKNYCIEQGADMMHIKNSMKEKTPVIYNDIFGPGDNVVPEP